MSQLQTLTNKLATKLDLGDGSDLVDTLKATAFKGQVSDSQMVALLTVANQHGLNPWTREIYAFPDKQNGIVPVVGVDGWSRIINSHEQFDGMQFEQDDESCTCAIYRKDRSHPTTVTEFLSECKRETQPWKSHPKRMLRHKAMIQAARLAFGFGGIFDPDEAEVIGTAPQSKPQQAAQNHEPEGLANFEAQHHYAMVDAAERGQDALSEAFKQLPKGPLKVAYWQKRQGELKAIASQVVEASDD